MAHTEIKKARIEHPQFGESVVYADFGDGKGEVRIMGYFRDELSFSEEEFVGLTREEASALHTKKDQAYLNS